MVSYEITDYEDDGKTSGGQGVGIPPGGGGTKSTGGVPPHLWALYQGGADTRDNMDYDMVGLGRGTWIWGVDVDYILI